MSVETTTETAPVPKKGMNILFGLTLLGLLLFLWLLLGLSTTSFWTSNNISNLLRQGAMTAILAVGQTFVIITAGIDLSVGAVVGFSSVTVAWLLQHGVPLWPAMGITLLVGVAIGAFHAFGIVRMGLPAFIITLATLTSLRGIGLLVTNGSTISISDESFTNFSRADFLGIPSLFWMVIVVAIPAYIFLHLSRWGRYLFAVGSNSEAAASLRRQCQSHDLSRLYPVFHLCCLCRPASRLAHRHRQCHAGRRLGVAGDRLLGDRRHQPVWRGGVGARAAARRLHPRNHQQRRQSAQRQRVRAAHHHRRADHRHRLFRPAAPPRLALIPAASGGSIPGVCRYHPSVT